MWGIFVAEKKHSAKDFLTRQNLNFWTKKNFFENRGSFWDFSAILFISL